MTLEAGLQSQEDRLLACVHCGFCLPSCPTYTRLGDEADSPRGRLHLMRAVAEGRLEADSDAFQTHMDRCLGCRACESVCPSGVEYGLLLELARERAVEARPASLPTRALPAVFGSSLVSPLALWGGRLLRSSGLPRLLALRLPRKGWWGSVKLAMAMLASSAPSRELARAMRSSGSRGPTSRGVAPDPGPPPSAGPPGPSGVPGLPRSTAGVLQGCVQAGLFGRVNQATARVLEANGTHVVPVQGQGCCGALHAHSGDLEGARRLARVNIAAFEAAGVDRVVVNAAGCGAAMKEYGHLLEGDPEWRSRAKAFAARVRDVTEVLVERPLRLGGGLPLRVTWDAPCHLLHAQRVSEPPLHLLRSIPGLELLPLRGCEECCGGAGIYALTHRELGGRIGGDKVAAVQETGAQVVATANPGCMMQIGAGLLVEGSGVEAVHPVELLDASYRMGGIYAEGGG
jgi:glycolate oxidase iron-sulfur subunit